jgi:hypothetical protein
MAMNLAAAIDLRNGAVAVRTAETTRSIAATAASVGPCHGECHDAATAGGFAVKSHDNFGSSYIHPDGTELRVHPNGNWKMTKQGNGAINLNKNFTQPDMQQQPQRRGGGGGGQQRGMYAGGTGQRTS